MNHLRYLLLALAAASLLALSSPPAPQATSLLDDAPAGWVDTLLRQTEVHLRQEGPRSFFVQTDRTLYGQGGVVWGSLYVLQSADHRPDTVLRKARALLRNSRDEIIAEQIIAVNHGRGEITLTFPADKPGGLYRLQVVDTQDEARADIWFEKDLTLHQPIYPRLRMELEIDREAYQPGDTAVAFLRFQTLQDRALAHMDYDWTLNDNSGLLARGSLRTNARGRDTLRIPLPDTLTQSRLLLYARVDVQGSPETISRSIQLLQDDLDLRFLPEGGTWIGGHPQTLAFKALDPQGKGLDCQGQILDPSGKVMAAFKSFHQGMGAFSFTPEAGIEYTAQVKGMARAFPLPVAHSDGFALGLHRREATRLIFQLISPQPQSLHLIGRTRGRVYEAYQIEAQTGLNYFAVPIQRFPAGAASFTLFDAQGQPQAERLVFLHQDQQLQISIEPADAAVSPGENVSVKVKVTDAQGEPVAASLSLAAVDTRNLSLINDKQADLPTQMLLSSELQGDIEEPTFYFDPAEKKAPQALDMLMLTQGWRRFAWEAVRATDLTAAPAAQNPLIVAGQVIARIGGKPIPNARVTMFHLDENWWAEEVRTDSMGYFSFSKPVTGILHLEISGKEVKGKPINVQFNEAAYTALKSSFRGSRLYNRWGNTRRMDVALLEPSAPAVAKPPAKPVLVLASSSARDRKEEKAEMIGRSSSTLDEVVILGYGTTVKNSSASVITGLSFGDKWKGSPLPDLLQERVAGVSIQGNNGPLSAPTAVQVRGARSLSSQTPLVLIDGMPMGMSALSGIDPASVRSVKVQKSGSTALYGARAAHGVILVETDNQVWASRYSNEVAPRTGHLLLFDLRPPVQYVRKFYGGNYQRARAGQEGNMTFHWEPLLEIGPEGEAEFTLTTPKTATTFALTAMGIGRNGQVGRADTTLANIPAIAVQAKVPPVLTAGDLVHIPLTLRNNRPRSLTVSLQATCWDSTLIPQFDPADYANLELPPEDGLTLYLPFLATNAYRYGNLRFNVRKKGKQFQDLHRVQVIPQGFPFAHAISGSDSLLRDSLILGDPIPGTLDIQLRAYADVIASMEDGRNAMLRQPHGCFEQTSSSNFPNVLALHLMQKIGTQDGAFQKKALDFIKKGHDRLKGFETPSNGFSLWGKNPPHLHMSARGLMQFEWMAKVYPDTDRRVIDRTQKWLLMQRNGSGRFNTRHHWRYGDAKEAPLYLHALVAYALASSGVQTLQAEIDWMYAAALEDTTAYTTALCSRALMAFGDTSRGHALVRKMMDMQQADGLWAEKGRSAMGGYGSSFGTELNALCLLAALDSKLYAADVLAPIVGFLQSRRSHGRFGSTMTTVLVLEAFAEYQQQYRKVYGEGRLELWIDGQLYQSLDYSPEGEARQMPESVMPDLQGGKHQIEVRQQGTGALVPFSVNIMGHDFTPASQEDCRVELEQTLARSKVLQGDMVGLDLRLKNKHHEIVGNPMLRIGIPPGLQLQLWQLKEMQERGDFAYYEVHDTELWLYLEYLEAHQTKALHLDLLAEVPGRFEAPASSAYLYYTDEFKHWHPGLQVTVTPRP